MLVAALVLNIAILVPVVWSLVSGGTGAQDAFGPATDARRILTCIYGAIGAVSAALVALHWVGHGWAVPMTLALFAVQISYKLATVAVVGPGSPVVITNLVVVGVQVVAIVWAVRAGLFTA